MLQAHLDGGIPHIHLFGHVIMLHSVVAYLIVAVVVLGMIASFIQEYRDKQ